MIPSLMTSLLALTFFEARIWYAVPLIVVISLVYGATRHEYVPEILKHAAKAALWVIIFMLIILALIMTGDFFI